MWGRATSTAQCHPVLPIIIAIKKTKRPYVKTRDHICAFHSWTAGEYVPRQAWHISARYAAGAAGCRPVHHAATRFPDTVVAPGTSASASPTLCSAGAPPTTPSPDIIQQSPVSPNAHRLKCDKLHEFVNSVSKLLTFYSTENHCVRGSSKIQTQKSATI